MFNKIEILRTFVNSPAFNDILNGLLSTIGPFGWCIEGGVGSNTLFGITLS